jgi:large subunit ribosomal protein L30
MKWEKNQKKMQMEQTKKHQSRLVYEKGALPKNEAARQPKKDLKPDHAPKKHTEHKKAPENAHVPKGEAPKEASGHKPVENQAGRKAAKEDKKDAEPKRHKGEWYAAVQIRGTVRVRKEIKDTLRMLNLQRKHACVVVPTTPVYRGMLHKCKDYITYGEVSKEILEALKKARKPNGKTFALHPPKGGFERKGIKKPFMQGGALGYRADKINDLIKRML